MKHFINRALVAKKHLKLIFALFAMLALGVGNAWGETTISFGYSNWDGVTANFSGTAKDEVTQTVDGVKVTYTRNGSNLYANTSAIRFYKSNTLKFDAPTGYSIQSIAFTCTSYQTDITSNVGTCTATSSNLSWSGDATSVTFTRPSSASSYATITGATVTLAATSGGSTPDPGTGEGGEDPETPGTGGTVTYTVSSVTAVTTTGNVPEGSTAVLSGTGSLNGGFIQCTNGKNHTLTLTGYEGYMITGVTIHVKSNSSKGTGSFSVMAGSTAIASITESAFNTSSWNGSWNTTGVDKTLTMTNDSYKIQSGENVTLTINCKSGSSNYNSLYVKSYTITYKPVSSSGSGTEEPVPSLTTDQFSWNATTATATLPNTFDNPPTLTNTENLAVSYSSSNEGVAKIDANGNVTLVGVGTADIKATAGGEGTTFKETTVFYTLTVNKAPATPTENVYVKVTSTAGITDGEYLIVYEDETAPVAFDGSLATLDVASNNIAVTITDGTIAGNTDIDAATFTIDNTAGTLKSASGKYIGVSSNSNGLKTEDAVQNYKNAFSIDDSGNAVIAAVFDNSDMSLRYNSSSNNGYRFRYYQSGQQPIALYKKASEHTVTIATCTNGSVVASVVDGAKVLSGTTVTLENTPATGYKLAAYDVYKTDDATTKVTVTDGKFIMPEFDVTISATFEAAKTLNSIEITTSATQTTFWQGETFNHNGLKVTAHFDGADNEDVTDKVTVTGSTATAGAAVEVTVSYTEGTTTKTITYTINVQAIPNTKETAYTVADAYDIIDKLTTAEGVFISGIISQVDSYNITYKSITYWISADGTTTNQLQVYSGKGLESADFSGKTDLSVGDQVIVCGTLKKYEGTYEFDKNNYLASHTPTTKDPAGLAYTTTSYTANVGEAFTTPELTNPHNLVVTYSTSDASKATVDANTGAVTIVAAGVVTITAATTGDATHDAGSASYTITITDLSLLIATLPFEFNGKQADIEGTAGMTHSGIDAEDYKSAPYLKMNTTGDWLVIHFDSEPEKLSYDIKNNSFSGGTFSVQESADGETYTDVAVHTEITNTQNEEHTLLSTSRYVKFIYTNKVNGNVGLGNITISKPDNRAEAGIAWNPSAVTLTQGDEFTAPTLQYPNNITGTITYKSNNDEVATVTAGGEIALASAIGTATITATFAGDDTYKPATATCTITVNEYIETIDGEWELVTDASKLQAGMEIIIASVEVDGKYYTMSKASDNGNNRTAVESTISGDKLNPAVGTSVLTLVDAGNGTFALQAGNNYLYAASSTSNHLKETATIKDDAKWSVSVTEGKASVVAQGSNSRNTIRFNKSNNPKIFSCYASGQTDIALYSKVPEHSRTTSAGRYGTICLPGNIVKCLGATLYEVAGKDGLRVVFDEVLTPEEGMPYIFLAHNAEVLFYCGDKTAATPGDHKSLHGTFSVLQDEQLKGMYMVQNNKIVKCADTGCGVAENRAYFNGEELEDLGSAPAPMPGRRRITMGTESENTATGTEDVVAPAGQTLKIIENGQLIIIRNGEKFNAQGQTL